mmetsp:Transcript_29472/g.46220  ORF Transcript_29472/g.46220 Transcript_29472/m.46220 type:complete len:119 (-) Transcript_29472:2806-3162(-)
MSAAMEEPTQAETEAPKCSYTFEDLFPDSAFTEDNKLRNFVRYRRPWIQKTWFQRVLKCEGRVVENVGPVGAWVCREFEQVYYIGQVVFGWDDGTDTRYRVCYSDVDCEDFVKSVCQP